MAKNTSVSRAVESILDGYSEFVEQAESNIPGDLCEVCGVAEWSKVTEAAIVAVKRYLVSCDCGSNYVAKRVEIPLQQPDDVAIFTESLSGVCSNCDRYSPIDESEVIFEETLDEFEVEVEQIQCLSHHRHHLRYNPEETITVCSTCHVKIHNQDGFHDELRPKDSRPAPRRAKQ